MGARFVFVPRWYRQLAGRIPVNKVFAGFFLFSHGWKSWFLCLICVLLPLKITEDKQKTAENANGCSCFMGWLMRPDFSIPPRAGNLQVQLWCFVEVNKSHQHRPEGQVFTGFQNSLAYWPWASTRLNLETKSPFFSHGNLAAFWARQHHRRFFALEEPMVSHPMLI